MRQLTCCAVLYILQISLANHQVSQGSRKSRAESRAVAEMPIACSVRAPWLSGNMCRYSKAAAYKHQLDVGLYKIKADEWSS